MKKMLRVSCSKLAEDLGATGPDVIRTIVERRFKELSKHGDVLRRLKAATDGGTEYLLNERQVMTVLMMVDTPRAEEFSAQIADTVVRILAGQAAEPIQPVNDWLDGLFGTGRKLH